MYQEELQKIVELLNGRPRPLTEDELFKIGWAKENNKIIQVRNGGHDLNPKWKWQIRG